MIYQESHYLPQFTSDLFPGPWVIFAPHPDDETYGMGGSIALARSSNIQVYVIVLTDGALGGVSEDNLVCDRKNETITALSILGQASVYFLGEPDRNLQLNISTVEKCTDIIVEIFSHYKNRSGTVFVPSLYEPHPDHRVTAMIAWESLNKVNYQLNRVFYEISVQSPSDCMIDITSVVERKKSAMNAYFTQERERNYADRILSFNRNRTWSLPESVLYAESFSLQQSSCASLDDVILLHADRHMKGLYRGISFAHFYLRVIIFLSRWGNNLNIYMFNFAQFIVRIKRKLYVAVSKLKSL